jgi:hypothetical protein
VHGKTSRTSKVHAGKLVIADGRWRPRSNASNARNFWAPAATGITAAARGFVSNSSVAAAVAATLAVAWTATGSVLPAVLPVRIWLKDGSLGLIDEPGGEGGGEGFNHGVEG